MQKQTKKSVLWETFCFGSILPFPVEPGIPSRGCVKWPSNESKRLWWDTFSNYCWGRWEATGLMINQTMAIYWLLDCLSAPLHLGRGEPRAWCWSNLPRQSTKQASKEIAIVRLVIRSRQHLGGGEPRAWQFNSSRSPSVPRTSRGCNRSFKNLYNCPATDNSSYPNDWTY